MRSLSRVSFGLVAVVAFVGGLAVPADAAELAANDVVVVREGTVVPGDLYAAGLSVRIHGEVHGDLVAAVVEDLIIDGRVTGSVTVMGGSVIINGTVDGSVRAATTRVTVNGTIGRDLVMSAFTTRLEPGSHIGGEVVGFGFRMWSLGTVEGDVSGSQRFLNLAGHVGGNIVVGTNRLTVVDQLTVGGNLSYRSGREAQGLENARVEGTITRRSPLPPNIRIRALTIFAKAMVALFLTIAAVTVIWGWPDQTKRATERVGVKPWKSWLIGAGIFLSPLVLVALMFVMLRLAPAAAALPLAVILIPIILAGVGVLLAVGLVAGIPVAAALGTRLFKRFGPLGAVVAGSLTLAVVWMLPIVGLLVPLLFLPLGLGAWLLSRRGGDVVEEGRVGPGDSGDSVMLGTGDALQ